VESSGTGTSFDVVVVKGYTSADAGNSAWFNGTAWATASSEDWQIILFKQETGLTKSLADTITLTDSRTVQVNKALADAFTLNDSRAMQVSKALADTVNYVDVIAKTPQKALADSVTLVDNNTRQLAKVMEVSYLPDLLHRSSLLLPLPLAPGRFLLPGLSQQY
jgi:hypothetical protein